MAYDGSAWDETDPTNATVANEIDDVFRGVKTAVRSRMVVEHLWPSSQSATNEAGLHRYVTLAAQSAAPSLVVGTNTQAGAVYINTDYALMYEDSAGDEYVISRSGAGNAILEGTGTLGDLLYITSGGQPVALAAATSGYLLTAQGTGSAPAWAAPAEGLGSWESKNDNTNYEATTDGFVVAYYKGTSGRAKIIGYTDNSATPSTIVQEMRDAGPGDQETSVAISFPVKSGDYYKVVVSGAGGSVTTTINFVPLT